MNPTEQQRNFVKKCGHYACDILLLNSFGRTWNWIEEDVNDKESQCNKAATIGVDLKYKELTIEIYPCFWENTESEQFEIIFHEFCHAHTEVQYLKLYQLKNERMITWREVDEAREHETSLFEKSFVWLLSDPKQYKETAGFIKKLKTTKVINKKKI